MHQVEIKVRFRAGHRLMEPYKGKCNNPHGEGYTAILIFESDKLDENGMVIDFGKVKKYTQDLVNDFYDHSFMFNLHDENLWKDFKRKNYKIYIIDGNPTAENIAKDLYDKVKTTHSQLKRVGIIESFDDSIAWYEEKLDDVLRDITAQNVKYVTKDFLEKLGSEAKKMFQGIKLDTDVPSFDWDNKKCATCQKLIPGFSEYAVWHWKKRRDFCSQHCLDDFMKKYKEEKKNESS